MFKVLKLESLKSDQILLCLDDDNSFEINLDTIAKFNIYEGKELTQEELDEIVEYSLVKELKIKSVSYISYSPRTEYQVRSFLKKLCIKKNKEDFDIENIIEELKEFKYINDLEFAKIFIKSRLKNKPKPKFVLKSELISKGIDKELSNELVEKYSPDDFETILKLYEKKYKNEIFDISDKKKISFFQRKGYSWDDIKKLINFFKETNDS